MSCNKLCGHLFTKKNYFINFNHVSWSNILYMTCGNQIQEKIFILSSCALWIKIYLKVRNGHKNEEMEKKI